MFIRFDKIEYRNFLSTGNKYTKIDLRKVPKTVIHGTNGSGKTTFVDALYFALYGKSFRKVKKDSVVNYITGKNTLVKLSFQIRKDSYLIVRGIKPAIFEIFKNDELIPKESTTTLYQQYLETFILHMNEKMFTQTVLLGSTNYTPFMLLPAADRRNVVEALLDIQIFTVMNELAKAKNKELQRRYDNTEYEIEKHDIRISELQKHIDSVQGNQDLLVSQNEERITSNQILINETYAKSKVIEGDIVELEDKQKLIGHKGAITKLKNSIAIYQKKFVNEISTAKTKSEFYDKNDNCPTCSQEITDELKDIKRLEYTGVVEKYEDGIKQAEEKINEQLEKLSDISTLQFDIDEEKSNVTQNQSAINSWSIEIASFENAIKDIEKSSDVTKDKVRVKSEIDAKTEQEIDLSDTGIDLINYETVLALLKDNGIKTRIVKTYIPVINKLIKKYLDILEFPIVFQFDESFNEFIKVRGRDEVTFPNLSEGERMRVNLSLIFAFRELAKLRNATHCNLIIFDEVADSSLDNTGWDSFLKILNDVCSQGDQNTFVISHKGDQIISKFDRDIRFDKIGGRFSEIV